MRAGSGPSASALVNSDVGVLADPAEPVEVALVAGALGGRQAGLLAAVECSRAARVVGADVEEAVEPAEGGGQVRVRLGEVLGGAAEVAWNGCAVRANGRIWSAGSASPPSRAAARPCWRCRAPERRAQGLERRAELLRERVDLAQRARRLAQRAGQLRDGAEMFWSSAANGAEDLRSRPHQRAMSCPCRRAPHQQAVAVHQPPEVGRRRRPPR